MEEKNEEDNVTKEHQMNLRVASFFVLAHGVHNQLRHPPAAIEDYVTEARRKTFSASAKHLSLSCLKNFFMFSVVLLYTIDAKSFGI